VNCLCVQPYFTLTGHFAIIVCSDLISNPRLFPSSKRDLWLEYLSRSESGSTKGLQASERRIYSASIKSLRFDGCVAHLQVLRTFLIEEEETTTFKYCSVSSLIVAFDRALVVGELLIRGLSTRSLGNLERNVA
jgi:hypothetical protein